MTQTTQVQNTNQALQKAQKPSALNVMAARLSVDGVKLLDTLKSTVFRQATNEELLALVTVANEYELNPFLKEIYAFPAKGGGIVPVVSVDGWNKMLNRQPNFDGIEFEMAEKEDGTPHSCTAIVYIKNRSKPMRVTEYFDECKRNTDPWNNMPRRMLRNRTLCQASRMAFGFSGVYNDDEASTISVEATVMPHNPPPKLVETTAARPDSAAERASGPSDLEQLATAEGFTFEEFRAFVTREQLIKDVDSMGSFDDVPDKDAKRLLRAQAGLVNGIKNLKGEQ
jgi:phage recombination protein Bet